MNSIYARYQYYICLLTICASTGCFQQPVDIGISVKKTFGQRQLEQMLEDRPDMNKAIPLSHPARAWLIDGFNGKRYGQRIYWNGNSPQSGRPAEHAPQYGSYPPYISISGGTETTAIDRWIAAVYEIYNLEGNDFASLTLMALDGSLNADEFAERCVELEFVALEKTQEFFRKHPPPASSHGRDKLYNWISSDLGTFEEYKNAFDVPGSNTLNSNFAYFKEYYESTIVPYANTMRQTSD